MEWKQLQKEQEKIHTQLRKSARLNEQGLLIDKQIDYTQQEINKHSRALDQIRSIN